MKQRTLLFILCCLFIGLTGRLINASNIPLWLDERYSLYFAQAFSQTELLQGVDSHPSGYYLLLRWLSQVHEHLFFLRIGSSVVWELFGTILLVFLFYKKKNTFGAVFFAVLYLCNSFLHHHGIELRMYSLVWFLGCLGVYILQLSGWSKKYQYKLWIAVNVVGIFFSYMFFFYGLLGLLSLWLLDRRKRLWTVVGILTLALTLLVVMGHTGKERLQNSSWIPYPNFFNTPSVLGTLVGVDTNFQAQPQNIHSVTAGWIVLLLAVIIAYKKRSSLIHVMTKSSSWVGPVGILCCMVGSSILYALQFTRVSYVIPSLSFFLPRALLIFLPAIYVFLVELLQKNRFRWPLLWCLGGIWLLSFPHTSAAWIQQTRTVSSEELRMLYDSAKSGQTIFPPWVLINLVPAIRGEQIRPLYALANQRERTMYDAGVNPIVDCQTAAIQQVNVYTPETLPKSYQTVLQNYLRQCCVLNERDEVKSSWMCR